MLTILAAMSLAQAPHGAAVLTVSPKWALTVKASLGGRQLNLLFDSGAERTVFPLRSQVRGIGWLRATDSGGGMPYEWMKPPRLDLGGTEIPLEAPLVWDLPIFKEGLDGLPLDGILGRDVIAKYVWLVDIQNASLEVWLPSDDAARGAVRRLRQSAGTPIDVLPLKRGVSGELLLAFTAIGGIGSTAFDTATSTISLASTSVKGLLRQAVGPREIQTPHGTEKRQQELTPRLTFGRRSLLFPLYDMAPAGSAGTIGPRALGASAFVLDGVGNRLYLSNSGGMSPEEQFLKELTGLDFIVRGSRVSLARNGRAPSDPPTYVEVRAINGIPMGRLMQALKAADARSLSVVAQLAKDCQKEVRLQVFSDGKTSNVTYERP